MSLTSRYKVDFVTAKVDFVTAKVDFVTANVSVSRHSVALLLHDLMHDSTQSVDQAAQCAIRVES